jgi:hypothetical protein
MSVQLGLLVFATPSDTSITLLLQACPTCCVAVCRVCIVAL